MSGRLRASAAAENRDSSSPVAGSILGVASESGRGDAGRGDDGRRGGTGALLSAVDGWTRLYEPLAVSISSGENLRGPLDALLDAVDPADLERSSGFSCSVFRLLLVVVSIGSGRNFRRGRGGWFSSVPCSFLSLLLIVVVSTGSGANFRRGLEDDPSAGLSLSLLLLVLVSTGSGAKRLLEVRVLVSTGSGAKRRGMVVTGPLERLLSAEEVDVAKELLSVDSFCISELSICSTAFFLELLVLSSTGCGRNRRGFVWTGIGPVVVFEACPSLDEGLWDVVYADVELRIVVSRGSGTNRWRGGGEVDIKTA